MERKYRITIFVGKEVVEREFYRREITLSAILEFKKQFDDFYAGILSEKIKGKWVPVCSIIK